MKTILRKILLLTVAVLIFSFFYGCKNTAGQLFFGYTAYAQTEGMSYSGSERYGVPIHAGLLHLLWFYRDIVLMVCSAVFLLILFYRSRKSERLAVDARIREQALIAENDMLDRLNRMKTQFFQNMSHDFKTPLTVISTCVLNVADVLDFDDNIDKDEMRESLEQAQREIMRMSRMVDSAMKLSAMHDGRQDIEPVDIAYFLREAVETYRVLLERHGNILSINIPKSLPHISGNTDMLLHVIANILSNANRYTRDGEIIIQAQKRKGEVAVTIKDNGQGVAPEILPRIFERGVSDRGTGLGLSICKTAIEEIHNGTILVESEYGKGTAVTFTLPVCDIESGG